MDAHTLTKSVFALCKDCLFPAYCLSCDNEGTFLCGECKGQLEFTGVYACPVCHRDNGIGAPCLSCAPASDLDRIFATCPYKEKALIGRLIHALKYHYIEEVVQLLASKIREQVDRHRDDYAYVDAIIPVPLHPRRYAERGFNQAVLIGELLASCISAPVHPVLARVRSTMQQALLSKIEREANVQDAFAIVKNTDGLKGKRVILVDDVFTTGSTMQECARVLKNNGVREVIGWTVARG